MQLKMELPRQEEPLRSARATDFGHSIIEWHLKEFAKERRERERLMRVTRSLDLSPTTPTLPVRLPPLSLSEELPSPFRRNDLFDSEYRERYLDAESRERYKRRLNHVSKRKRHKGRFVRIEDENKETSKKDSIPSQTQSEVTTAEQRPATPTS
ncbi:hypothetical protein NDN08_004639 [Rhodosorus marinus]|uniref:CCT domain-containing protein n=1 Tax=Rhodosorus marinus TaxID=101924 RepID=A0AAV8UNB6_9RHOD|nr:hypothetical protein NDN08_004639 [Rhodosorus marinus]